MSQPFDPNPDPPMVAGQDYILVDEYSKRPRRPAPPRRPSPTQASIRSPFDPDPRHVDEDELWDPQAGTWVPRPSGLIALLAGLVLGVVIGFLFALGVVHAAPRSVQTTTPQPGASGAIGSFDASAQAPASTSSGPTGAPLAAPSPPLSAAREAALRADGAPTPAPAAGLKGGPSPAITEPPAIEAGLASYCEPTPTRCQSWGGDAHLGAVPSFRWGDRPYRVKVCRQDDRSICTTVRVVSYCGCGNKIIDLSLAAFTELAPKSRGVVAVTVVDAGGAGPTPPATDIEP